MYLVRVTHFSLFSLQTLAAVTWFPQWTHNLPPLNTLVEPPGIQNLVNNFQSEN